METVIKPFEPFKIGLISGLNYGGEDYRVGLWEAAFAYFRKEKPLFVVLDGWVVDSKALTARLKEELKLYPKEERKQVERSFVKKHAEFLAKNIPVIRGINIYIVTSPAYDGQIGNQIVTKLARLRKADIRQYRDGGDKLELRQIVGILSVLAPKKSAWLRGDYYDTPGLRVLKDEKKRSSRGLGDVNVVGCFGSSVFHPGDSTEVKKPYFLIPVLHKIGETRTAENQVGFAMLHFVTPNPKEVIARTVSLKDLVSDERQFINPPEGASELQKKIVEVLKERGACPAGVIQTYLNGNSCNIATIKKNLVWLSEQPQNDSWPGLKFTETSNKWYFCLSWFSDNLRYTLPKNFLKDKFLVFGCLHAGCKHTDMKFFRDVVPEIMLQGNIDNLCGVGDFIEGMKHDLILKGEVYGSRDHVFNYSIQEKLSAYLVGSIIFKVFRERIKDLLPKGFVKLSQEGRLSLIRSALPNYFYIPGNHCEWAKNGGFDALSTFRSELKIFLMYQIEELLTKNNICVNGLLGVIQSKLIGLSDSGSQPLPSGLSFSMLHPGMSGTKTPSIRPQGVLSHVKDQIVFDANFHTHEAVCEWCVEVGQRVCLQVGTMKIKSGFENSKLKTVDTGVGILKVLSKDNRIFQSDANFRYTPTPNMQEENRKILDEFEEWLKIGK